LNLKVLKKISSVNMTRDITKNKPMSPLSSTFSTGTGHITKKVIAKEMGISRSSLYYKPKRPALDEEIKSQIESVLLSHPAYGHKRIAIALKLGKNRVRRVMKKFDLKPHIRRSGKPWLKQNDLNKPPVPVINIPQLLCPLQPEVIWVSDFTYLKYHESFIYLATIIDAYTREVVGYNISRYHTKDLVIGALIHALGNRPPPIYLHSDQGSEYDCYDYYQFLTKQGIIVSMSDKSSPWQNGKQESFYGHFKQEMGTLSDYKTLGELIEAISIQITYYNTDRIHSKLKMSPRSFYKQFQMKCVSKLAGT